jgi:DNA-directed RNA polymerase
MRKLNENRLTKIYTPIFLDAKCSGIQHLAALIKDLELGSRVNLIPQSETDEVGDIYSYIVGPINNELNKLAKENIEFAHFENIALTRSIVK